jgi:peptidyl-prolyl cis-trans isomerase SurA
VKVEKGIYIQGENKAIDKYGFKIRKSEFEPGEEYPYVFVVGKILKNKPEEYHDVRGLVTADYQEYLEKEWIVALRAKYPVEIDKKILSTIKDN